MDSPPTPDDELPAGYEKMAADEEREREALEWAEALISDGFDEPE